LKIVLHNFFIPTGGKYCPFFYPRWNRFSPLRFVYNNGGFFLEGMGLGRDGGGALTATTR